MAFEIIGEILVLRCLTAAVVEEFRALGGSEELHCAPFGNETAGMAISMPFGDRGGSSEAVKSAQRLAVMGGRP